MRATAPAYGWSIPGPCRTFAFGTFRLTVDRTLL
jgi:hypothetical protein